ncbi:MAG: hypothetical protein K9J50_05820 [Sulfuritalea sp.]|nr:hypothetical protein [Sulfuritalea sp.]
MNVNSYGGDSGITDLPPLFFRNADRLRLEGCVAALAQDGMSLAMVSSNDALLDHYGKLLVARLRDTAPQITLEVYFPASAEALLARFNDVLVDSSVDSARDATARVASPKIWIVHDASALPDHEIQLLARLVQNFPGANIRVVMLLTTASKKQQLLSAFGRRILNWEIEPPTQEQKDTMLEMGRTQGREGVVSSLLQKISASEPYSPSKPLAALAATRAQSALNAAYDPAASDGLDDDSDKQDDGTSSEPSPWRIRLKWAGVTAALLLSCSVGVALLYGGLASTSELSTIWKKLRVGDNPFIAAKPQSAASAPVAAASAPKVATAPLAAAPSSLAASAPAAAAPVIPVAPVIPETSATPVAPLAASKTASKPPPVLAPVPAAQEVVISSNDSRKPAPAVAPAPATTTQSGKEIEVFIGPSVQTKSGHAWVEQLPLGGYLIQHTLVASFQEAGLWLKRRPALKRARIVALYLPNQTSPRYAVMSGPFASMAEADTFMARPSVPDGSQVRSSRSVKEQLSAESAKAAANRRKEAKP